MYNPAQERKHFIFHVSFLSLIRRPIPPPYFAGERQVPAGWPGTHPVQLDQPREEGSHERGTGMREGNLVSDGSKCVL